MSIIVEVIHILILTICYNHCPSVQPTYVPGDGSCFYHAVGVSLSIVLQSDGYDYRSLTSLAFNFFDNNLGLIENVAGIFATDKDQKDTDRYLSRIATENMQSEPLLVVSELSIHEYIFSSLFTATDEQMYQLLNQCAKCLMRSDLATSAFGSFMHKCR